MEELNLTVVTHQIKMRGMIQAQDEKQSVLLNYLTHDQAQIYDVVKHIKLPITITHNTLAAIDVKSSISRQLPCVTYG